MSLTAVVPVRAGSRRMKNKNIAPFNGTTLLEHKIEVLKKVPEIDNIVVTSDSDEMLNIAKGHGVLTHKRPDEYCDEVSRTYGEMIKYVCSQIEGDHILWTLCTTPLVYPALYSDGIQTYYKALEEGHDSLMSVSMFKHFILDKNGPINFEFGVKQVTSQLLPEWYLSTSGIIMAPRESMIAWSYHIGSKVYLYEVGKIAAVDVDDELDFIQAEAWLKSRPDIFGCEVK